MKVIGYMRVSTEEQSLSLEFQADKLARWCELNDHPEPDIYYDNGKSGSTIDKRPGLIEALEAVTKGDIFVVYKLDRLSRSIRDAIEINEQLHKKDVNFVSIVDKIDTTTATGKMFFHIVCVFAEFERDLIIERTSAALSQKKKLGEKLGTLPYGFDGVPNPTKKTNRGRPVLDLVPNEHEQEGIKLILFLKSSGLSIREIGAAMVDRGYPPKNKSTKWSTSVIKGIIDANS